MSRARLAPGECGVVALVKLPSGRWEARAQYRRLDGALTRVRHTDRSKATAETGLQAKVRERLDAERDQTPAPATDKTFAELTAEFLTERELYQDDTASYRHEEARILRHVLLPRIGDTMVSELRPAMLKALYQELYAATPALARTVLVALRKVMDLAVEQELIEVNTARVFRTAKRKRKAIFAPEPLQLDELRDAVRAYRDRPGRNGPPPGDLLKDVIEVILGTSARIGEALGLRWEHIDLLSEVPTVTIAGKIVEGGGQHKHYEPVTKTEAGLRTIPIPAYLVAVLLKRRVNSDGNPFVFHTGNGSPNGPQDVHRALRNVRKWAGISEAMVPHALRRSVATVISETAGIESAARTLGHKQARVTETHYARRPVLAPDVREALARLAPRASGSDSGQERKSGPKPDE